MTTTDKDIKSVPIYDRSGKLIGNLTGRKEQVERFSNHDLANQLEGDRRKYREQNRR